MIFRKHFWHIWNFSIHLINDISKLEHPALEWFIGNQVRQDLIFFSPDLGLIILLPMHLGPRNPANRKDVPVV